MWESIPRVLSLNNGTLGGFVRFQVQVGKGECSFWHDPWKGVTLLANDVDFVDI